MRRLIDEIRRLLAQILVGWLIRTIPSSDHHTLQAIKTLLDAMDRDAREK